MSQGQSALEYLMTYGWGLIIVAITIGVLLFVTGGSAGGITCQTQNQRLVVREWSVATGTNGVGLVLQNSTGGSISPISATSGGGFTAKSVALAGVVPVAENLVVQNLAGPPSAGNLHGGNVNIVFRTQGGLDVNVLVVCSGNLSTQLTAVEQVLSSAVMVLHFDEGAGASASDSAGNGYNGAISGASWVAGRVGQALFFDNSGDFVTITKTYTPSLRGTVVMWLNPASISARDRVFGGTDKFEILLRSEDNKLKNQLFAASTTGAKSNTALVTGTWYHTAFTWDASTNAQEVYVNGVREGTAPDANDIPASNLTLSIGTRTGSTEYYHGIIDEVALFDRVLSQGEIQTLFTR